MNNPYEILFRWKDDGTFSGGHTIRRDSVTGVLGEAQPIGKDTSFPWPSVLGEVDAALLVKSGQVDDLKAAHDAVAKERDDAVAALAAVDPQVKIDALAEQKSKLLAQVASVEAQIEELAP